MCWAELQSEENIFGMLCLQISNTALEILKLSINLCQVVVTRGRPVISYCVVEGSIRRRRVPKKQRNWNIAALKLCGRVDPSDIWHGESGGTCVSSYRKTFIPDFFDDQIYLSVYFLSSKIADLNQDFKISLGLLELVMTAFKSQ